jgi:hypothetical protein
MQRVAPHIGWNCRSPRGFPPCPGRLVPSGRGARPTGFPALAPREVAPRPLLPTVDRAFAEAAHGPNWTFLAIRSLGASPPVDLLRVHSRGLPPFGIAVPAAILVPPSWFQPTSTVFSALQAPVYCNRRRSRFVTFQSGAPFRLDRLPVRAVGRSLPTSPRRTSHPSKNLQSERSRARTTHPTKQPFRVTAILASVPFLRLRGFAPLRGPASIAPPLPARRRYMSFHGFCSPSRHSPPSGSRRASCEVRRDIPPLARRLSGGSASRPLPAAGLHGVFDVKEQLESGVLALRERVA